MKIAVCFSGMIRTGIQAFPAIERFIGDLWSSCDFFMHTWDLDYHNVLNGETLEHFNTAHGNLSLDNLKLNTFNRLYNIKSHEVENYWSGMNNIEAMFSNYIENSNWIIPWFYSWHKSILIKKKYEKDNNIKYDYVVKIRPDVIFNQELTLAPLIEKLEDNQFGINMIYKDWDNMVTDDILFISKNDISDAVSDWWIHRIVSREYKDSRIPEMTHFYNYVKSKGAEPVDLDMKYLGSDYRIGLLRQECTMFNPITEFDKCVECDKLHYHVYDQSDVKHLTVEEIENIKRHTRELRKILPTGLK